MAEDERTRNNSTADPITLTSEELAQVSRHWAQYPDGFSARRSWTEIPSVKARINGKITGNPNIDIFAYVIHEYFLHKGRSPENCLSLGCGVGEVERGLAKYITPKKHVGIEISGALVELARERSAALPHIQYRCEDLNTCDLEVGEYDLVIALGSLHHVLNLEGLFERVKRSMRSDAIFAFDEYVGPRRFQWTERQLDCINAISQLLPPALNRDIETGLVRQTVVRCTPEQVAEADPSEAIRSDEILPLVQKNFRILEFLPYGGTILHMLLHMKAGNFLAEGARPWLDIVCGLEDLLLPELGSDFAAVICTLPDNVWLG